MEVWLLAEHVTGGPNIGRGEEGAHGGQGRRVLENRYFCSELKLGERVGEQNREGRDSQAEK